MGDLFFLLICFQEKPKAKKEKVTTKQVITYDIQTPAGDKKGM